MKDRNDIDLDARIALGLITRHLNDPTPIYRFLENARANGHTVDRFIIAYSHSLDESLLAELRSHVRIDALCAHGDENLKKRLMSLGLTTDEIDGLLDVPSWPLHREVPYGTYRNVVLLQAILEEMDYLLFFDTDIEPRVLTAFEGGQPTWKDVDFIGSHMASLPRADVVASTSDYSGFYIIPPMSFDGLEALLFGLGKGMALEYMADCHEHQCLNLGPESPGAPTATLKPLGGNLGLSLDCPQRLAPFFSTIYTFKELCIKGRGEDTLLGQVVADSECHIMDINLLVFHDTYDDFPTVPDIRNAAVRDRFYWACLGWIGRNPFMTWFLDKANKLGTTFREEIDIQRKGLKAGSGRIAGFLDDPRFEGLPDAFEASLSNLPATIHRYERLMVGWQALLDVLAPESVPNEIEQDSQLRLVS